GADSRGLQRLRPASRPRTGPVEPAVQGGRAKAETIGGGSETEGIYHAQARHSSFARYEGLRGRVPESGLRDREDRAGEREPEDEPQPALLAAQAFPLRRVRGP